MIVRMNATERIDDYLNALPTWKRDLATHLREQIRAAVPDIVEEWKWDTPVFARRGNVCAIGVFADHIKVNFFKGASLDDPDGLLNAGLDAKTTRSIDLREGDRLDDEAFRRLVAAAAARNG
jgi:hypothetical protein